MNNRKHILRITLSAMFIAISIILMRIFVFPQGMSYFRLSLGNVPIIIGGILLGPIYGAIIGLLADVIGASIFMGANFLVFPMISSVLYGLIPGLIFLAFKRLRGKIKISPSYPLLLLLLIVAVIYFSLQTSFTNPFNSSVTYLLTPLNKFIAICLTSLVVIGLLIALYFSDRRLRLKDNYKNTLPSDFAFIVIVTELIVDVLYTPIWKRFYFGLPYYFTVFIHILILLSLLLFKTLLLNLIAYSFNKSRINI